MSIVYYDLGTTGFNHARVQICSIAATYGGGEQEFHRYLIPTCSIPSAASNIHGMTKVNGQLYLNGRLVEEAVPIAKGLDDFLTFLDKQICQNDIREVLLVAHNNHRFDAPVLRKNLGFCRLSSPVPLSLFDSMDLMKLVKSSSNGGLQRISLNHCLQFLLQAGQADQHNAKDDANDVRRICHAGASYLKLNSFAEFVNSNPDLIKRF